MISRGIIDCKQHFASRISEAFCSDGGRGVRWCSWSGKCDGQALASLYPCACIPFLMSMFPLHHVHRYRRCADAETGLSDLSLWEHGTLNDCASEDDTLDYFTSTRVTVTASSDLDSAR